MTREERQKQLDEEFEKNGGLQSIDGEPRKIFIYGSHCKLCKYYHGDDFCSCSAYPKGIPDKYALRVGDKLPLIHNHIESDQVGEFVFTLSSAV